MTGKFSLQITKPDLKDLNDFVKQLNNPKDFLKEVGEIIVEDIKHRIVSTKLDPEDQPWAPWAESTRKARQNDGTAALGLLFQSGNLAQSINYRFTSKNNVQIGTSNKYAGYLNDGTDNMPARPFMGLSKRSIAGIEELLKLHFGVK